MQSSVICRRCGAENAADASVCARCGAFFARRPTRESHRPRLWWAVPAALAAAAVLWIVLRSPRPDARASFRASSGPAAAPAGAASSKGVAIGGGDVVILDEAGAEVSAWTVGTAGGWAPIPVAALAGGPGIAFRRGERTAARPTEAGWISGDPVALLRIDEEPAADAPVLAAWRKDLGMEWRALPPAAGFLARVPVAAPMPVGSFLRLDLPNPGMPPGVFLQGGRVVGWTFGSRMARGYLWAGPDGDSPPAAIRVERLAAELAGKREAALWRCRAFPADMPPSRRLEAVADAFRRDALIPEEDWPPEIDLAGMLDLARRLAAEMAAANAWRDLAAILDERALAGAGDAKLLEIAASAVARTRTDREALDLLASFRRPGAPPIPGADTVLAKFYASLIERSCDEGRPEAAELVYDEARRAFPNDPGIRLGGARAALLANDRESAREILDAAPFPEELGPAVRSLLASMGAAVEPAVEDAIEVPFEGDDVIVVEVRLNDRLDRRFIVDTGSSRTSISSATAVALGIQADDQTKRTVAMTAAGPRSFFVVRLESIEIGGCVVADFPVDVLDTVGEADFGLIGMDVLTRLGAEIDHQKKVLRLRKR